MRIGTLQNFALLVVAATLALSTSACATKIKTQPKRLEYLQPNIESNLAVVMKCHDAKLTHLETVERTGPVYYDFYTVEGCGQSSEYLTTMKKHGGIHWGLSVVPTGEQYEAAVKNQLQETAATDLTCEDLQMSISDDHLAPLRDSYHATVGVSGCDKRSDYKTICTHQGYEVGRHKLACEYENLSTTANDGAAAAASD